MFCVPEGGLSHFGITGLKIPTIFVVMHFGIRKAYVS
jgi:hypothetical protein